MARTAYTVELKPAAFRALKRIQRKDQLRIGVKIDSLGADPRPQGCEKLAGEEDLYRVRVGDYRILYTIRDNRLLVLVVEIGHRREVYRR